MTQSKTTAEDLVSFYTQILESLNMVVDDHDRVSLDDLNGSTKPITIDGKRLVVPTAPVRQATDWSQFVAFHPMGENLYRGQSPVIKMLRRQIHFRISTSLVYLIVQLTPLAADEKAHAQLKPRQKQLLSVLPRSNQKTVEMFTKVANAYDPRTERQIVNIYLKHGGALNGERHSRTAIAKFPIRNDFNDEDAKTILGVKFSSKKDYNKFIAFFDYLLPGSESIETYSYGSDSLEAPYFEALMQSYVKIAKQLNSISWLFRKHLGEFDLIYIPIKDVEEQLQRLRDFHGVIPGLDGNAGDAGVEEQEQAEYAKPNVGQHAGSVSETQTHRPPNPEPAPAQPPTAPPGTGYAPPPNNAGYAPPGNHPPQPAPPPQQTGGSKRTSWSEIMGERQQTYGAQPGMQQQYPMQQPMGAPPYPGQQYQMPMQYPGQQPYGPMPPQAYGQPMAYPGQQPFYPQHSMYNGSI